MAWPGCLLIEMVKKAQAMLGISDSSMHTITGYKHHQKHVPPLCSHFLTQAEQIRCVSAPPESHTEFGWEEKIFFRCPHLQLLTP